MAKLILSMDGLVLKEIPLTKERTTIGRKPHNDIQIDNLAVSGEHAVIVTILNDSFLEDLGSTNGTVVNGNPIKKHFLQNNDVVELGKYKLKFIGEAAPAAGGEKADFEKTMVLRPSAMKAAAAAARAGGGRRAAGGRGRSRSGSAGGRNCGRGRGEGQGSRAGPGGGCCCAGPGAGAGSGARSSCAGSEAQRPPARRYPAFVGRERRQ